VIDPSEAVSGYETKFHPTDEGFETTLNSNSRGFAWSNGTGRLMTIDRTGDAVFQGKVTIEGNRPVSTKVDLINTLSTLRQATMDETQDIRESLRSAIDELVAGLEHEISTMPAPEAGE
jgi:hypothetical protein